MKNFIIAVLVALFTSTFIFLLVGERPAEATQGPYPQCKHENAECQTNDSNHPCCSNLTCVPFNGQSGNGKCQGSVPSVTPTPTVIITPTPEIIPCEAPSKFTEAYFYDFEPCVTPTVSVTPTPVFLGNGDGRHTDGPGLPQVGDVVCRAEAPQPAFNLNGKRVDADTVHITWTKSGTGHDAQILKYGRSKDNLEYGIPSLPADSEGLDVKGIDWNTGFWFQVGTKNGDCYSWSDIVDP